MGRRMNLLWSLAFLGLWLLAPGGHAAITHVVDRVQTPAGPSGPDTTSSAAFTPGAGNLLVVTIKSYTTSSPSVTVSDNVNGTWTQAWFKGAVADPPSWIAQFYRNNVAASSTIVTVNPNSATFHHVHMTISEFTGQETGGSLLEGSGDGLGRLPRLRAV